MSPLHVFTFALALYSLSITGWYQHEREQSKIQVAKFERIILNQEKMLLEMDNRPVECDRSYTFDQFISDKPCPPGKDGPLCHMDESDYK